MLTLVSTSYDEVLCIQSSLENECFADVGSVQKLPKEFQGYITRDSQAPITSLYTSLISIRGPGVSLVSTEIQTNIMHCLSTFNHVRFCLTSIWPIPSLILIKVVIILCFTDNERHSSPHIQCRFKEYFLISRKRQFRRGCTCWVLFSTYYLDASELPLLNYELHHSYLFICIYHIVTTQQ